jgi:hypothetical protein
VSISIATLSPAAKSPIGAVDIDEFARHNYIENFEIFYGCGRYDCPLCYGKLDIFDKPQWFIVGLPETAPEVVALRAKKVKLKKLLRLQRILKASVLLTTSMSLADSMTDIDAGDYLLTPEQQLEKYRILAGEHHDDNNNTAAVAAIL